MAFFLVFYNVKESRCKKESSNGKKFCTIYSVCVCVSVCVSVCVMCLKLGNIDHIGVKQFRVINWLPTKERFEQCLLLTSIYSFINHLAPAYIAEIYCLVEQSHKTRSFFQKLILPFQTSNRGLRTISYLGPRLWNALLTVVKSAGTANTFKHKIK